MNPIDKASRQPPNSGIFRYSETSSIVVSPRSNFPENLPDT